MKFTRKNVALPCGIALLLILVYVLRYPFEVEDWFRAMMFGGPAPTYDLLLARDNYENPYSDESGTDIVIRVKNHKATAIYTGKAGGADFLGFDLFVCKAADGEIHKIPITFQMPYHSDAEMLREHPNGIPIPVPELDALTVDHSSIAPDGAKFVVSDFNPLGPNTTIDFNKAYFAGDFTPGMVLNKRFSQCFSQFVGHSVFAGVTIHFIGWIIP